jgi:hypothetical protein
MAKSREVRTVQNPALLAASSIPGVLAMRQQSGVFRAMTDPDRIVRVGLPGMADVGLIVAVTISPEMVGKTIGACIQAEFKTATGRQSADQRTWAEAVRRAGGVYELVRSADQMVDIIARVRRGEW